MSSLSLEEYSNVLFDCDGVLLDSNEAKDVAFKKVLDGYDVELQDSFVEFVREHRGLSRYAKFEWFVSNCLGYNVTSMSFTSEVDKLLHKFSDINSSTLLKCEVVSETKFWAAKPFLQEQSSRR